MKCCTSCLERRRHDYRWLLLEGNTSVSEDKELTARIIKEPSNMHQNWLTQITKQPSKIEIVKVNVGFRPFREDGARVEVDKNING